MNRVLKPLSQNSVRVARNRDLQAERSFDTHTLKPLSEIRRRAVFQRRRGEHRRRVDDGRGRTARRPLAGARDQVESRRAGPTRGKEAAVKGLQFVVGAERGGETPLRIEP